jgi:hypothetical protein
MSLLRRIALWLSAHLPETWLTPHLLAFGLGTRKYHEDK